MNLRQLSLLIFSLLFAFSFSHAFDETPVVDQQICLRGDGSQDKAQALQNVGCGAVQKSCEALFPDDIEIKAYIRGCETPSKSYTAQKHILGCLALFPQPLIDSVKKLLISAGQAAKQNVNATKELIDLCKTDPAAREWMVSQVPVLRSLKSSETDEKNCATTIVEFSDWSQRQKQSRIFADVTDHSLRLQKEKQGFSNAQGPAEDIFQKVWKKQKAKFACLDNYGKTYLSCYYAFAVLDPTLAVGAAVRMPALLRSFGLADEAAQAAATTSQAAEPAANPVRVRNISPAAQRRLQISSQSMIGNGSFVTQIPRHRQIPADDLPAVSTTQGIGKVEAKLGYKPTVWDRGSPNTLNLSIIDPKTGRTMGTLEASYLRSRKTLTVDNMGTEEAYRNMGVGEATLETALRKYPETRTIHTQALGGSNGDAVAKALHDGKSVIEAIKETAAYKIRARLGFTEIIEDSINSVYGFSVRRPSP